MLRVVLIVTGVTFTLLGSLGLLVFGTSLVELPLRFVNQANEPPTGFDSYRLSAAAAVMMALGATLMGFVSQRDSVRLSSSGKATVALASLLAALATVSILYGLFLFYRLIGTLVAEEVLTASELGSEINSASMAVRAGFGLLVGSQVLVFAAALNLSAATVRTRRSITVKLSGVTYMVTAWLIAALFSVIYFLDARSAELLAVDGPLPADRIAESATSILMKAAMICFCLFLQAGCLAAIGFSKVRD